MTDDLLVVLLYLMTLAPFAATAWIYAPSPWRGNPMGRALMRLLLSVSAVLLLAILLRLLRLPIWLEWALRVATLGAVQVAGWLLFRQFRRHLDQPSETNGAPR